MPNKCNQCGKFFSPPDGVKCLKCTLVLHRACAININNTPNTPPRWCCRGCKEAMPSGPELSKKNKRSPTPVSQTTTAITDETLRSDTEEDNATYNLAEQIKLLRYEIISVSREMSSFRQEIARLNITMSDFNERVNKVETKITSLEKTFEASKKDSCTPEVIKKLKQELLEKEQESFLSDIEITGLQELSGDNPVNIVCLVGKKLDIPIEPNDIVFAERSGPRRSSETGHAETTRPRPIVVRLTRRALRNDLLRAARVRRGADSSSILEGSPRRFYINERLTRTNRHIFYIARELGRKLGWRYIWTKEGRIYARQKTDSHVQKIRSDEDLEAIFGSCVI